MVDQKLCGICSKVEFKYRCSICTLPLCSLNCYKSHKENSCKKDKSIDKGTDKSADKCEQKSLVDKIYDDDMDDEIDDGEEDDVEVDMDDDSNDANTSALLDDEEENDMNQYVLQDNEEEDDMALHPEELEKLAKSEKIKEFLRDDKLREIIHHINFTARSGNVEDLLDVTRKNDEIFFNFTEEILNTVIGPKSFADI
ncbi:hypothetical protein C2G38_2249746 [Gigaspora rosea]|uniref:HIT-type domain-containing protein n=1 Tax=Gigaspora rosea TaxID=44941 RepID=A0A397UWZ6_9GLOM|nr:hypothetical protein C2G38_2249746 [Gigaspora rosea]